jgi:hypothetical protein
MNESNSQSDFFTDVYSRDYTTEITHPLLGKKKVIGKYLFKPNIKTTIEIEMSM